MEDARREGIFKTNTPYEPGQLLYLHGLGSSPRSLKGALVHEHFTRIGYSVHLPDLNLPSFEHLSPLAVVRKVVAELEKSEAPQVHLVGSSFGGLVALHALAALSYRARARVTRFVLLAPALYPWDPRQPLIPLHVEERWRESGVHQIYHHDRRCEVDVHFRFVEELRALDAERVVPSLPTLIIHGTEDQVVPVHQSVRFCALCPAGQLELIDDGHELLRCPTIFLERMEVFLAQ